MIKKIINYLRFKIYGAEVNKDKLKKMIKNDKPIILEIGANRGTDSEEFLSIFPNAKLYLFEPDPRMTKILHKKFKNNTRVILEKIALSNKKGKSKFYLSESSTGIGGKDSSSLKKPKKHLEVYPEIKFNKKIYVKTETLDNWIKNKKINIIDFIWADVQGAERELIIGGMETLNEKTKYLYTEFYNEEMYQDQMNLKSIKKQLYNFKLIGVWGNNALFKNKKYE